MCNKNSDDPLIFVAGTLLGVLTGVIAGVMFSPKAGTEIRKDLKDMAKSFSKEMPSDVDKVKNSFSENLARVKFSIESQMNKINDAVKAGRLADAKIKEELDESSY